MSHTRPNPTIAEVRDAAIQFCETDWEMARTFSHAYTRSAQIAHRCLEGLYITTLLEQGFGFDPSSRNITIALEVEGHEVEWTLGFALADATFPERSKDMAIRSLAFLHTFTNNIAFIADAILRFFQSFLQVKLA